MSAFRFCNATFYEEYHWHVFGFTLIYDYFWRRWTFMLRFPKPERPEMRSLG